MAETGEASEAISQAGAEPSGQAEVAKQVAALPADAAEGTEAERAADPAQGPSPNPGSDPSGPAACVEDEGMDSRRECLQQDSSRRGGGEAAPDMSVIVASMAQQSANASASFRRGDVSHALAHMEKALQMCDTYENMHPALAVESARVKISSGAIFSSVGAHQEALTRIKDAQRSLSGIIAWADECDEEQDPGVISISAEARALQCAALVAEGIALESNTSGAMPDIMFPSRSAPTSGRSRPPAQSLHSRLYEEASHLGQSQLPSHPIVALARQMHEESTVSAANPGGAHSGCRPGLGGREVGACCSLPPVGSGAHGTARGSSVGHKRSLGDGNRGLVGRARNDDFDAVTEWASPDDSFAQEMMSVPRAHIKEPDRAMSPEPSSAQSQREQVPPSRAKKKSQRDLRKEAGRKDKEKKDIFKQFLKDAEAEKDAMRAGNEVWQEDARRRLGHIHKSTKLLLDLSEDVELKDKKYTTNGHKVMMQTYLAENKSRNDPQLVREARRVGTSPEILQVRKYSKNLYIKPKTPPPIVREVPKPKIDEGLASMLGRPRIT